MLHSRVDRAGGPLSHVNARFLPSTPTHIKPLERIKAFSETDFTDDLKKFDVSTLIIHGDDDQIVPIDDSAMISSKIVADATLKVYAGAPHGITSTHKEQFNADLLTFLRA